MFCVAIFPLHCAALQVVLLSELGCPAEAEQLELIIQVCRVYLHTCIYLYAQVSNSN